MKKTITSLGEFGVIRELLRGLPAYGVGDDATVLPRFNKQTLVTTDLLQEGVHFERRWASWADVGFKALQVNMSDIAAMGGRPQYYWLTLSLPRNFLVADLRQLRAGLKRAARPYQLRCAGGDTNRSKQGVSVAVTLLGQVGKCVVPRDGARVGDDIYVTGQLGEAALGLAILSKQRRVAQTQARYVRRQLRPMARVKAGQALAALGVHAMIDVSDGLGADLGHVLDASGVGAHLDAEVLRPSPTFRQLCQRLKRPWQDFVLCGGEDYELLFCAPSRLAVRIQGLSRRLKLPMTKIGRIVRAGQSQFFKQGGYEHFS